MMNLIGWILVGEMSLGKMAGSYKIFISPYLYTTFSSFFFENIKFQLKILFFLQKIDSNIFYYDTK